MSLTISGPWWSPEDDKYEETGDETETPETESEEDEDVNSDDFENDDED